MVRCRPKRYDLMGQTFNDYTVVAPLPSKKYRGKAGHICSVAYWLCRCICGKEVAVSAQTLRKGIVIGCGCRGEKIRAEKVRKQHGHSGATQVILTYKRHASTRGIAFNLSRDEFVKITQEDCHYCGSQPSMISWQKYTRGYTEEGAEHSKFVYNGVDRIDSSKGYFVENCVAACNVCNLAKNDMSVADFLGWVEKVYRHQTPDQGGWQR